MARTTDASTLASRVDFAALQERIASAFDGRAEDPRAVLEARARALARPAADLASAVAEGETVELLVLRRGQAAFAVAVEQVLDVVRVATLTPLPGADAPVCGVLPWRGRLLTVVDLAPSEQAAARVVVVQSGSGAAGVIADAVDDVRTVGVGTIHPSAGDALIRGTTSDAVSLLDPAELMRRIGPAR